MTEIAFKGADKIRAIAVITNTEFDADKEYLCIIKEKKPKRSLSANGYAWKLLDKLAEVTKIEKTEIYRSFIREIGGNCEQLWIKTAAVQAFKDKWESGHIGRFSDEVDYRKDWTLLNVYSGSSDYNSTQMSRLIDLIVQECKQYGIETMTPQEIAALMEGER